MRTVSPTSTSFGRLRHHTKTSTTIAPSSVADPRVQGSGNRPRDTIEMTHAGCDHGAEQGEALFIVQSVGGFGKV